jgi:hypothetical protein
VENNPQLVERCRKKVRQIGLTDRVEFVCRDMFSLDLGDFDAITIFQSQDAVAHLTQKLHAEVRDCTRIISYLGPLGSLSPLRLLKPGKMLYPFYLYTAPLKQLDEFDSAALIRKLQKFAGES